MGARHAGPRRLSADEELDFRRNGAFGAKFYFVQYTLEKLAMTAPSRAFTEQV